MRDFKRLGVLAMFALVALRIATGWQFFYEGLWKYDTVGTVNEWTAAGYLKNSRGPLRATFRGQLNDPDDLNWLEYDKVSERWGDWKDRFAEKYELTDEQKAKLTNLLDGDGEDIVGNRFFTELPDPKTIRIGGSLQRNNIIRFEEFEENGRKVWRLVVNRKLPLIPAERNALEKEGRRAQARKLKESQAAKDPDAKRKAKRQADLAGLFVRAVRDVYNKTAKLSYREQLAAILKGDADRVTRIYDEEEGSVYHKRIGQIDDYKARVEKYNKRLAEATTAFQQEHLNDEAARIAALHAEVVKPVQSLELRLQQAAHGLLTAEQKEKGELPVMPPQRIDTINKTTMWALMIIGLLLMVGLFSRLTALAGGLLVLSFYLAMPPFPGVPQPPGPEHSLIVNKNLIEVMALFALAMIPTGKFFGIDCFFVRTTWRFVRKDEQDEQPKPTGGKPSKSEETKVKSNGSKQASEAKEPAPVAGEAKSDKTYSIKS